MNSLVNYCNSIKTLSKELANSLEEKCIYKTYKAGDFILKENQISNHACFIESGLVRSFYNKEEAEVTTKFLAETSLITSIYSFYTRNKTQENIIALEDTVLICVHYDAMQKMLYEFEEFNFVVRIITEKYLLYSEIEIYNLRKRNAQERYLYFLKHHNALLQRVPLKYIASYLNMTLETLSRMRSKVRIS